MQEAIRQADEGHYDVAQHTLHDMGASLLRHASTSERGDELVDQAQRLEQHSVTMTEPRWTP